MMLRNLPRTRQVCHGYANACTCRGCKTTAANIAKYGFTSEGKIAIPPPPVVQPWEVRTPKRAA